VTVLTTIAESVSSGIVGIISVYYVLSIRWLETFTATHWTAAQATSIRRHHRPRICQIRRTGVAECGVDFAEETLSTCATLDVNASVEWRTHDDFCTASTYSADHVHGSTKETASLAHATVPCVPEEPATTRKGETCKPCDGWCNPAQGGMTGLRFRFP
jgi:hypothetical protein